MLGRITSATSKAIKFRSNGTVTSTSKRSNSICLKPLRKSAPFSSLSLYQPYSYSKSVVSAPVAVIKIHKRGHAGCGMPHDGEEVPGAGMERELRAHLNVSKLHIQDTSGNGSFYYVEIESPDFAGKTTIACHKLVQGIIANQIKNIHGLQLKTRAPKPE